MTEFSVLGLTCWSVRFDWIVFFYKVSRVLTGAYKYLQIEFAK